MLTVQEKKQLKNQWLSFAAIFHCPPLMPSPPQLACVYAFDMSDATVKIGVTTNVGERVKSVSRAVYLEVTRIHNTPLAPLDFMRVIEARCHAAFFGRCERGEFFNITFEEAVAELDKHADEIADAFHAADKKYLDKVIYFHEEFLPQYNNAKKVKPPVDKMPQIVEAGGVLGYVDKNNIVHLKADDVAHGLGYVHVEGEISQGNCGNIYPVVHWDTINACLAEFDYPPVKPGDFIPENVFYLLAMKANNAVAKTLQLKVANEILPAIRKDGCYIAPEQNNTLLQAQINTLKAENSLLRNQLPALSSLAMAVVYVLLLSNGSIKIGLTDFLPRRIKEIEQDTNLRVLNFKSTPYLLRNEADNLESFLKNKFSDQALGGEFFSARFDEAAALIS